MEKNIEIVVQVTEQLRSSKQGRYLENIADLCKTKHGWDLITTKAAIDEATQQQRIYTSVMNGKISYRKRKEQISTDEEEFRDSDMQTDPIAELTCRKDNEDIERLVADFQDFKEHTFKEISYLRAESEKGQTDGSGKDKMDPQGKMDQLSEALVRSLHERIFSLERQLAYQRDIISKLLDRPRQDMSTSQARIPSEKSTHAPLVAKNETTTKLSNKINANNENNTKEQKSPIVIEDIMETNQKDPPKNGKKKNKSKNKAQKQLEANKNTTNNEREDKPVETKEKEKEAPSAITTNHNVVILGDSMVKNLQGWRMKTSMKSNEKIIVRSFPGASTDDMSFHAVPSVKRKPRCFVLHTGANDFRDEEDNNEIAKTIFGLAKTLKADENTVYVSGIIKRDDDKMNARISNVNKVLKELCGEADFPFIDNSNIEVGHHLNRSGLHLNRFGDAKLAFNIISALRN
eukprot:gene21268-23343_t